MSQHHYAPDWTGICQLDHFWRPSKFEISCRFLLKPLARECPRSQYESRDRRSGYIQYYKPSSVMYRAASREGMWG